MIFLQKTPARILLFLGALAGAAWLASLDHAKKISTDILDLIPAGERSPELDVVRALANEKQARVALFALHAPDGGTPHGGGTAGDDAPGRAARAFASSLLASGAFAEVEITGDTASRDALAAQVFARRLELLLPGWLAENESSGSAALAEETAAALERFMSKPEALAFAGLIPGDPLLLIPPLVEKMRAFDTAGDDGAPGDTALIWSLTREKPLDPAGQKPVFDAVDAALRAARDTAPGATLRWTAISRFAAESRERIEREMAWLNTASLLAVLGVAALCLRRVLKSLHLAPVVMGAFLGAWVAVTLCFGRVHVLVFVVGSLLAGVAIDYGFYLSLQPQKTPGEPYAGKVRRLLKPLLGSAFTTVLGFSLLLFSNLPLIRQLGVFVSAGLLCALATALLWFAQVKNPHMQARAFASARVPPSPRARRAAIALLALGAAIALAGPWRLRWRDNIRELEAPTPVLTREAAALRALFGDSPDRTVYITQGETIAAARDSHEAFAAWHASQSPQAGLASPGWLIPLRDDHERLPSRLEKLRGFPDDFRAALERHGFDAGEFAPFFADWETFASRHAARRQVSAEGGGGYAFSDEGRGFNANGVVAFSPGLATQEPTLGNDEKTHTTPTGLRPLSQFAGHNPVGVDNLYGPNTQGSPRGFGQPWARGQNPVGVFLSTLNTYGDAVAYPG